jgi:hypothetical protein
MENLYNRGLLSYDGILILCPKAEVKGGIESLQSLYRALSEYTNNITISSDLNNRNNIKNHIIISPEIYINKLSKFKGNDIIIWWLSVDNYTKNKNKNKFRDLYHNIKSRITGHRHFYTKKLLIKFRHLCESHYASNYLKKYSIPNLILHRKINESFFLNISTVKESNIITFNPAKTDLALIKELSDALSEYKFIPLKDMSRNEIINTLAKSKLYIDFGHFPGSERLPREAALLNNFILISKFGSADNYDDFPLPSNFKINLKDRHVKDKIKAEIIKIMSDFYSLDCIKDFKMSIYKNNEYFDKTLINLL